MDFLERRWAKTSCNDFFIVIPCNSCRVGHQSVISYFTSSLLLAQVLYLDRTVVVASSCSSSVIGRRRAPKGGRAALSRRVSNETRAALGGRCILAIYRDHHLHQNIIHPWIRVNFIWHARQDIVSTQEGQTEQICVGIGMGFIRGNTR